MFDTAAGCRSIVAELADDLVEQVRLVEPVDLHVEVELVDHVRARSRRSRRCSMSRFPATLAGSSRSFASRAAIGCRTARR